MISVIIPAFRAEATLKRAVLSLVGQTLSDWQAVIVSDDGVEYRGLLASQGLSDPRLTFTSTGGTGTGCHNARNFGLPLAIGDYVTQLDADDQFATSRFADLLPLAEQYGAAADNLLMIHEETELPIGTTIGKMSQVLHLTLAYFMKLNAPLVPLIRKDHVLPRVIGVEFSEDVIANIQLIDRIGTVAVTNTSSYIYRIRQGSVANSEGSNYKFERGYTDYITRLEIGDGFGLSSDNRLIARDGLIAKRELNRAYIDGVKTNLCLSFFEFAQNWKL